MIWGAEKIELVSRNSMNYYMFISEQVLILMVAIFISFAVIIAIVLTTYFFFSGYSRKL